MEVAAIDSLEIKITVNAEKANTSIWHLTRSLAALSVSQADDVFDFMFSPFSTPGEIGGDLTDGILEGISDAFKNSGLGKKAHIRPAYKSFL